MKKKICAAYKENIDDFKGCSDLRRYNSTQDCEQCKYSLGEVVKALKSYNKSLNLTSPVDRA